MCKKMMTKNNIIEKIYYFSFQEEKEEKEEIKAIFAFILLEYENIRSNFVGDSKL